MHRPAVASVLALLAAAPAAEARCTRPGERVVVRSEAAVVTVLADAGGARRWYGCLHAAGRRVLLERGYRGEDGEIAAARFRLAGGYAGWVWRQSDRYDSLAAVTVANLRTGRRRRTEAFFQSTSIPELTDLAIDGRGRAVFTEDRVALSGRTTVTSVWAFPQSKLRLLDRGTPRTIGGVRLREGRVTWRRGDVPVDPPDRCSPRGASGTQLVAVGPTMGCLRSTGARFALGGAALDALGPFVAVRRGDSSVAVLDARSGAPAGPAAPPSKERASAQLDPGGAAAILHEAPGEGAVLWLARPGTEPEVLDRGRISAVELLDGRLTWRVRDRDRSVTL